MPVESRYRVRSAQPGLPTRAHTGAAGVASALDERRPIGEMRPSVWFGAEAPGGLALPAAMPTSRQVYAPRGVWLDDERLIVADTGNHRVLIWHGPPAASHQPADVLLGQTDFTDDGAQAAGRGPESGMRLPTGVLVHEGRLVVADAWNHRILVWDEVPEHCGTAPDIVLGQPDTTSVEENRGQGCRPDGFYWPFGIAVVAGRFYVADTGNRRVLAWDGIPEPGEPPVLVLGQPDGCQRDENRGEIGAASFRWVHDVAGTADQLFVADAGNHRVLAWSPPPTADGDATSVFGQSDFVTGGEFPYQPQTAAALRFPYAIAIDDQGAELRTPRMAVADTANNRVLLWDDVPDASGRPADHVLGQPDFASNGENRWDLVATDTLCWPYGLCLHAGRLAIADSGNNRVMIWELGR